MALPQTDQEVQEVREKVLEALGDPTRRRILRLLRDEPQAITELADRLPVSRPAVSKHLGKLRAAELVSHEVDGRRHVYSLRPEGFQAGREYLNELWSVALNRFKLVAENLDLEEE